MSAVHASRGPLQAGQPVPAVGGRHRLQHRRGHPRHRRARCRGRSTAPTTPTSARRSRTSCPGCAAYDEKVNQPGGFVLPAPAARHPHVPDQDRTRAIFTASPMDVLDVPEGRLLLQSLRSHDQFNTTIYGLERPLPRHLRRPARGVRAPRRHRGPRLRRRRRRRPGQRVGGRHRAQRCPSFRIVEYDTPRGCAAAYYPEVNPLVPLDSTARRQQLPDVEVGDHPARAPRRATTAGAERRGDPVGSDRGHKSDVEPSQLS